MFSLHLLAHIMHGFTELLQSILVHLFQKKKSQVGFFFLQILTSNHGLKRIGKHFVVSLLANEKSF